MNIQNLLSTIESLDEHAKELQQALRDVDRLSYLATYGGEIESKWIPIKGTRMNKPRYRVVSGAIRYGWRNTHRDAIDVAMRDFGGGGCEWLEQD